MTKLFKEINAIHPDRHIVLNGRILLEIESVPDKTEGGIILEENQVLRQQNLVIKGKIVSFSDGIFDKFNIKPEKGDIIFFKTYAGIVMFSEDETKRYRSISIEEVIGFEKQ